MSYLLMLLMTTANACEPNHKLTPCEKIVREFKLCLKDMLDKNYYDEEHYKVCTEKFDKASEKYNCK